MGCFAAKRQIYYPVMGKIYGYPARIFHEIKTCSVYRVPGASLRHMSEILGAVAEISLHRVGVSQMETPSVVEKEEREQGSEHSDYTSIATECSPGS